MRLCSEVIYLIRTGYLENRSQRFRIGEITVVEMEPAAKIRFVPQVIDALTIEGRSAANDAVHIVALGQKKFGKIGAILPGDTSDKRTFAHGGEGNRYGMSDARCRWQGQGQGQGQWQWQWQ